MTGLQQLLHHVSTSSIVTIIVFVGCCSLVQASEATEKSAQASAAIFSDEKVQAFFKNQHDRSQQLPPEADKKTVAYKKEQQRLERLNFYQDYLAKYYPKAFVICREYFAHMSPDAILRALQQIIDLFAYDPWLYFSNTPQGFKLTYYWEYVVDQLSLVSDFLNKSLINKTDKKIIPATGDDNIVLVWALGNPAYKDRQLLCDYLLDLNAPLMYQYYALSFDYLIKLFNEGILMSDMTQAKFYCTELEYVIEKLRGSMEYEALYQEYLTTARELIEMVKQRQGVSDDLLNDRSVLKDQENPEVNE